VSDIQNCVEAMRIVTNYVNEQLGAEEGERFFDTHLVWYNKTLQHWKALVITTLPDDKYYEVTYNGDKDETYLDLYEKKTQVIYREEVGGLKTVLERHGQVIDMTSSTREEVLKKAKSLGRRGANAHESGDRESFQRVTNELNELLSGVNGEIAAEVTDAYQKAYWDGWESRG
jgi:hypothetical protein